MRPPKIVIEEVMEEDLEIDGPESLRRLDSEHRRLCDHPEVQEIAEIESRMLRGQASPVDLTRYRELEERPAVLRLHLSTLRSVLEDFRSNSGKLFDRLALQVESEIAACEAKISAFESSNAV